MKPKIYPCFRYHKDHEPKLLKSEADWTELGGSGKGWVDHPDKVNGVPKEEESPELPEDSEPPSDSDLNDELGSKSDEELREMLMSQGLPKKKLKGLSRPELIGMIEGE